MCSWKVLCVVLACAAAGVAAPTADGKVSLENVVGRTVCPVKVVVDEDPHRIPRLIKMLKCDATTPNPMCSAENISSACCKTHHAKFNMSCVEVTDKAMVRFTNRPEELTEIDVSVGCTCLMTKFTAAHSL